MTVVEAKLGPAGRRLVIDPVWLVTAAVIVGLALADAAQVRDSVGFMLGALWNTAPFLLAAVLIAAYAKGAGADRAIARAFTGHPVVMIGAAAVFGGLSPFCSCGVIPVIGALLSMGVPIAPVMAFWLASPVMDPAMFLLTASIIGPEFAVAKTLAAVGLGFGGGLVTLAMGADRWYATPLRPDQLGNNGGCGGASVRSGKAVQWWFWTDRGQRAKFFAEFRKVALFLTKWLSLAFLLESLMLAYIDPRWIAGVVGGEGVLPVVLSALVGVPAYLNGHAATPLVSGLMAQGMSDGAALAFLVAGGVTSIPAAMAVFALVRRRIFLLYLGYALVGSVAAGLAYGVWS